MPQQIIAFLIIAFFLAKLIWQKRKNRISGNEFVFWFVFWFIAVLSVAFIKQIDEMVKKIGFGASGIDVLLYLAIALLFYFIFRLRLHIEKIEKDVTKIVRDNALNNKK